MGQAIFWSNVGIDVQTGLGAAITLVSISKAATGVAKYSGAVDPNVGDIILMSAQGMYQVDKRLFRIANVNSATKTFELENEDTSTYDSLVAGSFQVVTFGASFATVQSVNVSGGDPEFADVTTIHDNVRKRVPTIVSPLSFGMDNIFDLSDPGFVECNKAYKAKSMRGRAPALRHGRQDALAGLCGRGRRAHRPGPGRGADQGLDRGPEHAHGVPELIQLVRSADQAPAGPEPCAPILPLIASPP